MVLAMMVRPVTEKIKAFFGLNIAMGVVKLPEGKMYWQKKWLTNVPSFGREFSRNRFFLILRGEILLFAAKESENYIKMNLTLFIPYPHICREIYSHIL